MFWHMKSIDYVTLCNSKKNTPNTVSYFQTLSIDMRMQLIFFFLHLRQRMNATFSIVDFKTFLLVQTSKSSIQIASECTIKSFCFQNVRSSSNFKNIDSNCIRMHPCFQNILSRFNFQINASNWSRSHRLASLLSKFYRQFTTSKTSFQIASEGSL